MHSADAFTVGLVLWPADEEKATTYGPLDNEWQQEIKALQDRLCEQLPKARVVLCVEAQPWTRAEVVDPEFGKHRDRYAPLTVAEILVQLVGAPAVAVALYKVLQEWIKARAGRQIKLNFGSWQADFKGLSPRQVGGLFRRLQNIASKDLLQRDVVLPEIVRTLKIPAVTLRQADAAWIEAEQERKARAVPPKLAEAVPRRDRASKQLKASRVGPGHKRKTTGRKQHSR